MPTQQPRFGLICVLALAAIIGPSIAYAGPRVLAPANATEEISADAIANSLTQRKTRTLAAPATQAIDELKRIRKARGWNMHDRERLADAARELPQIDLPVFFAFDSAEILPEAHPTLNKLGDALARNELKGRTFVVAGHTDAKGTAAYNQGLSERRAEAVKRYLLARHKLSGDDLMTVGYGFEQPKNPEDPLGGENRRVQIVNLTK